MSDLPFYALLLLAFVTFAVVSIAVIALWLALRLLIGYLISNPDYTAEEAERGKAPPEDY